MHDKFPVLMALRGFKMATGWPEQKADTWAKHKLSEGRDLVSRILGQTKDRQILLREAFAALQALANA